MRLPSICGRVLDRIEQRQRITRLDNVYRGSYNYRVTKGGHKSIEGSLDLINSDSNKLDCFPKHGR